MRYRRSRTKGGTYTADWGAGQKTDFAGGNRTGMICCIVTEKAAAQAIPAIGAAGGAIINTIFIDHFQEMARGHFIVRRLERKYGSEIVEETYKKI